MLHQTLVWTMVSLAADLATLLVLLWAQWPSAETLGS